MSDTKAEITKIVNNVITIKAPLDTTFFQRWFLFLKPFHDLTNREIDVIAAFAKHRYDLSKVISDEKILDKVLMSDDIKNEIIKECDITPSHFKVVLSKFKEKNVLVDGKIQPKLLPNIPENADSTNLLIRFMR